MKPTFRIFYGCLGVALCANDAAPAALLLGVQSVTIDATSPYEFFLATNSDTNNAMQPADDVYPALSEIRVVITQLIKEFLPVQSILGANSYVKAYLYKGDDTDPCLIHSDRTIVCKGLLLSDVEYSLSVNGLFTVKKTYTGFTRDVCAGGGPPMVNCPNAAIPGPGDLVAKRQDISTMTLNGSVIEASKIQDITINSSISRQNILETSTRTPWGSYVKFPVITTCACKSISQEFDSYKNEIKTSCGDSIQATLENITIGICATKGSAAGEITINKAVLTSLNYTGGDVGSSNNQYVSFVYTSYYSTGILPHIQVPEGLANGCP